MIGPLVSEDRITSRNGPKYSSGSTSDQSAATCRLEDSGSGEQVRVQPHRSAIAIKRKATVLFSERVKALCMVAEPTVPVEDSPSQDFEVLQ